MDITAIYPKKNLSKPGAPQYKMPYMLRKLAIIRPNQVWSIDITYIPMLHGFMYLTAIIDVYSRCIMAWGLHKTIVSTNRPLDKENSIEVLRMAVEAYGAPEIIRSTCDRFARRTMLPQSAFLWEPKIHRTFAPS